MDTFDLRKRTGTGLSVISDRSKRVRHDGDGNEDDDNPQQDSGRRQIRPEEYTVGWICALPIEMAAAEAMLDEIHDPLPRQSEQDSNAYTLGRIGSHKIAIVCLPSGHYGLNNAIRVANDMRWSFRSINRRLVVGIGGAAPDLADIRLGDVVVSEQVIQYDFGKTTADGQFQHTSIATRPPQVLLNTVAKLRATHNRLPNELPKIIDEMLERNPLMNKYRRPQTADVLYQHSYDHVDSSSNNCNACEEKYIKHREPRTTNDPVIHHGIVASGNQVMKNGTIRRRISDTLKVSCFEMEAGGLMDDGVGCLVIRGICDYSDSHKNKWWQEYAAATAAAYAKEFLCVLPVTDAPQPSSHDIDECSPPTIIPRETDLMQGDKKQRFLESLDFEEREARHITIKAALKKTCEWFLTDDFYLEWLKPSSYSEHHGFLWISGKPGSGKSTLMKFIYSHTRKTWVTSPDTAVIAFFFNARGTDLEKSTLGLYRSLIFQTLTNFPDLYDSFDYHDGLTGDGKPTFNVDYLQNLLESIIQNLAHRRLVCFIDALDECDDDQVAEMISLFEGLGDAAAETGTQFYLCLSSRHYPHVEIQPCLRRTLEDQPGHMQDIVKYVTTKFRPGNRRSKVSAEITALLLEKAAGVFLWIVLVVEILNKELQNGRVITVKRQLERLPSGLMDLFERIVMKDSTQTEDLLLCIRWILFAKRPLEVEEFYYAMFSGLSQESDVLSARDPERITREDMDMFVVSSSRGLAEVTKTKVAKVQFIHESVRDFLLKENGLRHLLANPAIQGESFEAHSHDQLKRCCQFYLGVDLRSISDAHHNATQLSRKEIQNMMLFSYPFLAYAKDHLFYHADAAQNLVPQDDFLNKLDLHQWIRCHSSLELYRIRQFSLEASLTYIFASRGHLRLLRLARRAELSISVCLNDRYIHPLIAATANGHEDAVSLLLSEEGIDVNYQDDMDRTALSFAAEKGFTGIVKLLLSTNGTAISLPDSDGWTPLIYAITHGRDEVVELLMTRGGNDVHVRPKSGRLALHLAVTHCKIEGVRLILSAQGIDVNAQDDLGETPLHCAVAARSVEKLELLLGNSSINVNEVDNRMETPLHWSAGVYDSLDCVKLLLTGHHINVNARNFEGQTALHRAARRNSADIVKELLKFDGIDKNARDNRGRTALFLSAAYDNPDALSVLVSSPDVDVNLGDNTGRTPLCSIVDGGSGRLTQSLLKLLQVYSIDVNKADNTIQTPLSWAARFGSKEVVKQLILVENIILEGKNFEGRTPLSLAAQNLRDPEIISLLLSTQSCDINSTDSLAWTPLMWAVHGGVPINVRQLLDHKDCKKDLRGFDGKSALDLAESYFSSSFPPERTSRHQILEWLRE